MYMSKKIFFICVLVVWIIECLVGEKLFDVFFFHSTRSSMAFLRSILDPTVIKLKKMI